MTSTHRRPASSVPSTGTTHKNVRSAYLLLKRNLPDLFTYQKYPELNIPTTIDGYFASTKKKVAAHHGLRRDRRYKVICKLLKKG